NGHLTSQSNGQIAGQASGHPGGQARPHTGGQLGPQTTSQTGRLRSPAETRPTPAETTMAHGIGPGGIPRPSLEHQLGGGGPVTPGGGQPIPDPGHAAPAPGEFGTQDVPAVADLPPQGGPQETTQNGLRKRQPRQKPLRQPDRPPAHPPQAAEPEKERSADDV